MTESGKCVDYVRRLQEQWTVWATESD